MAARPGDDHDDYDEVSSSGDEDERSNRWGGAPSTWQDMNREEINTLTALDELRNRDLTVHLYNAFALKRRHTEPEGESGEPLPGKDINAATGETVKDDRWVPHRMWTAWPMSRDKVPSDDFMRHDDDEDDDKFSIRRPLNDLPSVALEEAVGASVLRFAKEKFGGRAWEEAEDGDDPDTNVGDHNDDGGLSEPVSPYSTDGEASATVRSRSRSRPRSAKQDSLRADEAPQDDRMDTDSENSGGEEEALVPLNRRRLEPAVATDDQLSYELMRPAVRSILAKMDATLMILHRSRDATINYISSSSDESDASETKPRTRRSRSRALEPPAKKRRGRPPKAGLALRLRTPPPVSSSANPAQDLDQEVAQGAAGGVAGDLGDTPRKKPGRPRKVYPRLEGETDREWAIRVAKIRKQPTPIFPDELDSEDPKSSNSEAQPRRPRPSKRKAAKSREASPEDSPSKQRRNRKTAGRLGLRDWKDVLGAAALAGFPQAALDRAARRCADLFDESMELRTLSEAPLGPQGGAAAPDRVVRYRRDAAGGPEHHHHHQHRAGDPSEPETDAEGGGEVDDDGEDDEDDETRSQSAARHIRASSLAASEDARGRSRSRSRSVGAGPGSRYSSRSRSASAAACAHFCPVRACPRAVEGFSRRPNLLRHMRLVHRMDPPPASDAGNNTDGGSPSTAGTPRRRRRQPRPVDVDSEDEMFGAVHVDGFLRPIRIRKGWRGAAAAEGSASKRLRHRSVSRPRKRDRDRGSAGETGEDDGYETRDVDMDG